MKKIKCSLASIIGAVLVSAIPQYASAQISVFTGIDNISQTPRIGAIWSQDIWGPIIEFGKDEEIFLGKAGGTVKVLGIDESHLYVGSLLGYQEKNTSLCGASCDAEKGFLVEANFGVVHERFHIGYGLGRNRGIGRNFQVIRLGLNFDF